MINDLTKSFFFYRTDLFRKLSEALICKKYFFRIILKSINVFMIKKELDLLRFIYFLTIENQLFFDISGKHLYIYNKYVCVINVKLIQ